MSTQLRCATLRVMYATSSPALVLNLTMHSLNPSLSKSARFCSHHPCHPSFEGCPCYLYPPITYPSLPPDTPKASHSALTSCVISFTSNPSQCTWARTCQGHLARIEPHESSCYPPCVMEPPRRLQNPRRWCQQLLHWLLHWLLTLKNQRLLTANMLTQCGLSGKSPDQGDLSGFS